MRIAIPVNKAHTRMGSGDYTSFYYILKYLSEKDRLNEYTIYFNDDPSEFREFERSGFEYVSLYKKGFIHDRLLNRYEVWQNTTLRARIKKDSPDVSFFIDAKMPVSLKSPSVARIQDLAFFNFPDHFKPKDNFRLRHNLKNCVKHSHVLIAISYNTKKDILDRFDIPESKIHVVENGKSPIFVRIKDRGKIKSTLNKYGIPDKYILHVGVLQKRKNIPNLIKAFFELKNRRDIDHKLVLVGSRGWLYSDIFDITDKYDPERKNVIFLDFVSEDELVHIYNGADVFAFPSLYEGFGIPIIEAMACGTPVVSSSASCMPEVGRDAAIYFDPCDVDDMADKIYSVISDKNLRKIHVERGLKRSMAYDWGKTASGIIDVIKKSF